MIAGSTIRFTAALLAGAALTAPLAAESAAVEVAAATQATAPSAASPSALDRFAPSANRREHQIDYQHWDEALGWMVVPMGPSMRQGAGRVDARTGTRRIYGHESRLRLEGNRVAFSYLTPQIVSALSEYRADLERVGTELDIASLPRNEQLAFWINLHNVAMIEAVANRYPLTELDEEKAIDDIDLVTIDGVALSPRDIREGIVYPNWRDPKVIYGFWRGVIGGPSIQRLAFTGNNVDALLALSAEEFVNSLRGIERWGGALRVSPIYEEAAPFYFDNSDTLRSHMAQYARDDVRDLLGETRQVAYQSLETDLADLSRGERDPGINELCSGVGGAVGANPLTVSTGQCSSVATRPNRAIQRLMIERATKLNRARKAGIRSGMVIYGDGEYAPGEAAPEVE